MNSSWNNMPGMSGGKSLENEMAETRIEDEEWNDGWIGINRRKENAGLDKDLKEAKVSNWRRELMDKDKWKRICKVVRNGLRSKFYFL